MASLWRRIVEPVRWYDPVVRRGREQAQDMLRKWESKEPEVYSLWQTMNGWVYDGFNMTYEAMGVDFD